MERCAQRESRQRRLNAFHHALFNVAFRIMGSGIFHVTSPDAHRGSTRGDSRIPIPRCRAASAGKTPSSFRSDDARARIAALGTAGG
jgi:hypothetical protein